MRSRIWILLLCLPAFGFTAAAQNLAKQQLVLPLANGGFVAFRSELPGGKSSSTNNNSLAALLYAQAFAGENRIIHRVLTDAQQNVVFGYDLWISADPLTKKFSVAVLPADDAFRRSFLKGPFATFPKSTTPQTLDDGDAVSLELLVNHESGAKIVDVVSVTFDRTRLRENHLESAPKDFTLEAVALGVKNYRLLLNGNEVSKSKSSIGCTGALLWLYIPERGRFIFSLVPREGYDFAKVAVLDENKIAFTIGDEHYEWVSSDSILPSGGAWNLWVLRDTNYTPLFSTEDSEPRSAPKTRSVFDKIEDALTKQGAELMIGQSVRSGNNRSIPAGPQRVMVGSADNMENLLPKSP
jgi:hypothetical protein